MNRYRKLLGSSRSGRFREPRKRLKFSPSRRQSVRYRSRYVMAVAQKWGGAVWAAVKVTFALAVLVWAVALLVHASRNSGALDIKQIVFRGDTLDGVRSYLVVKPGQNIFSIRPRDIESDILNKFREIKTISVRRNLMRDVVVDIHLRTPVAVSKNSNELMGVDEMGELFRLPVGVLSTEKLLAVEGTTKNDRQKMAGLIEIVKKESPEFFDLIEHMELKNGMLQIALRGDIRVTWGVIDEKNVIDKAKNILRLMREFQPIKASAKLGFITDDRIVMDANWVKGG